MSIYSLYVSVNYYQIISRLIILQVYSSGFRGDAPSAPPPPPIFGKF